MRSTGRILVIVVLGLAGSAVAGEPGCASCNKGTVGPWDAEACAAPCGFTLAPGCCEERRHCCDNAWDGYCEHRAKVDACWARLGTSAAYARCRPCRQTTTMPCTACESCEAPTVQPMPTRAVPVRPVAPAPTPDKNTRDIYRNRIW
jgi:hypothetical protein